MSVYTSTSKYFMTRMSAKRPFCKNTWCTDWWNACQKPLTNKGKKKKKARGMDAYVIVHTPQSASFIPISEPTLMDIDVTDDVGSLADALSDTVHLSVAKMYILLKGRWMTLGQQKKRLWSYFKNMKTCFRDNASYTPPSFSLLYRGVWWRKLRVF